MTSRQMFKFCVVAAMMTAGANFYANRGVAAPPDQADAVEGIQVLTRGPVHEAFAATVTFDPQPGIIAPKEPPEAIEELPPSQKPEGTNVSWIPGYWAWDEEREDFLWVSGTWRALPPGRQWVPGYWAKSSGGAQWTSGYWADASLGEVQYLPEPPATVETGPTAAAPAENQIWVPGNWVWNQNRYAWQPGYWAAAQQNWMWIPSHYQYSPRGYVFVNGYYDYSLARRGVLFAPVHFNSGVYGQQGFTYSPAMAISMAVFSNQLFLRPNYGHYYFGDYYGSNYSTAGYYPWFSYNSGGYGYDPFYAQQAWQNRQDPAWAKSVQTDFQNRVANESARPPRTFADQQTLLKSGNASGNKQVAVAMPLDQLARARDNPLKFQAVTREEQQALVKHGQALNEFRSERQKLEAKGADTSAEKPSRQAAPATAKFGKSPIQATPTDKLARDHTPPKTHDTPASDPKVEPKPRQAAGKQEPPVTVKTAKPELPKVESKPAPTKPVPKAESKPDAPKVAPKPAPKVETNPVPKTETKPLAPKVDPKPNPKPEPGPVTPKVDPRPEAPKAGPKPEPKIEPKPERPRGVPKESPKQ